LHNTILACLAAASFERHFIVKEALAHVVRCCLRRPKRCQKRPTIGAKETYYARTFEHLPALAAPGRGFVAPLCSSAVGPIYICK
jgi:hypothetical protein